MVVGTVDVGIGSVTGQQLHDAAAVLSIEERDHAVLASRFQRGSWVRTAESCNRMAKEEATSSDTKEDTTSCNQEGTQVHC